MFFSFFCFERFTWSIAVFNWLSKCWIDLVLVHSSQTMTIYLTDAYENKINLKKIFKNLFTCLSICDIWFLSVSLRLFISDSDVLKKTNHFRKYLIIINKKTYDKNWSSI